MDYICNHEYDCQTKYPLKRMKTKILKVESRQNTNSDKGGGMFATKKIEKKKIVVMNQDTSGKKTSYSVMSEKGHLLYMDPFISMANHSCKPNCKLRQWMMDGDVEKVIFGLESLITIQIGTEITFDYAIYRDKDEAVSDLGLQKCLCNSENCRGTLGSKPKK